MKVVALDLESSGEVSDAVCGDCLDAGLAGKGNASLALGTWHLAHKTSPAKVLIPKVRPCLDKRRLHDTRVGSQTVYAVLPTIRSIARYVCSLGLGVASASPYVSLTVR